MNEISTDEQIEVKEQDGKSVVCSVEVAEHYEKRHDNLMQAINRLLSMSDACKKMFFAGTYTNSANHEYPCYFMTRDGFSILTMGFTGQKALEWKVKYINAFNKMEHAILSHMDSYQIEDPVKRAQRWIEEKQAAMEVQKKLDVAAPKAETYDQICTARVSNSFTEAAKLLGVKRSSMIEQLERHEYLYRNKHNVLIPYARYAEAGNGYFVLRKVPYGDSWRNREGKICRNTNLQTFVTMEGIHAFRRLMKKWNVRIA